MSQTTLLTFSVLVNSVCSFTRANQDYAAPPIEGIDTQPALMRMLLDDPTIYSADHGDVLSVASATGHDCVADTVKLVEGWMMHHYLSGTIKECIQGVMLEHYDNNADDNDFMVVRQFSIEGVTETKVPGGFFAFGKYDSQYSKQHEQHLKIAAAAKELGFQHCVDCKVPTCKGHWERGEWLLHRGGFGGWKLKHSDDVHSEHQVYVVSADHLKGLMLMDLKAKIIKAIAENPNELDELRDRLANDKIVD